MSAESVQICHASVQRTTCLSASGQPGVIDSDPDGLVPDGIRCKAKLVSVSAETLRRDWLLGFIMVNRYRRYVIFYHSR